MAISLNFKTPDDERLFMKRWLAGFIAIITIALAIINGVGAWEKTGAWPYVALAVGAEGALVVMFSLIVLSQTWLRRFVGFALFIGLAIFCVDNGKTGIKAWMDEVFIEEEDVLRKEAEILMADAAKLDTLPTDTKAETDAQRAADREELAALRVEQKQMQAQDKQGIEAAQLSLKAQGKYKGAIDGIRADLTEAAMDQRGAEIAARIEVLQAKLDEGSGQNTAVAALAPAAAKRLLAAEKIAQADKIRDEGANVVRLLYTVEGVRSFGVWAFLMTSTATLTLGGLAFWRKHGRRATDRVEDEQDAPPEQEREAPAAEAPEAVQEEAEAPAAQEEPAIVDPVDAAIDQATGTKPRGPAKGGESTAFDKEAGKIDDSLPIDATGVADMERAA